MDRDTNFSVGIVEIIKVADDDTKANGYINLYTAGQVLQVHPEKIFFTT
jgi:hypothetical protein